MDLIAGSFWQNGCFSIRGGHWILFGMCNYKKRQQHNENKINNVVMMIFPNVHIIKIWIFLKMLRALKNHYLVAAVPLQHVTAVKTYGVWE